MPINVINQPFEAVFSCNPVCWKLQTDDHVIDEEFCPAFTLTGSLKFQSGQGLTISWIDPVTNNPITINFRAVTTPGAADELPDDNSTLSKIDYYTEVLNIISSHPAISTMFTGTLQQTGINCNLIFKSKLCQDIGLTVTHNIFVVATSVQNYVAGTYLDNFKICIELWIEDPYKSNNYYCASRLSEPVDDDGCVTIDIQEALHHAFGKQKNNNLPDLITNDHFIADNLRCYYLRITTKHGTIQTTYGDWEYLPSKKVLCGGLSEEDYGIYGPNFTEDLSSLLCAATWQPNNRFICPDQPLFVSYINSTGATINAEPRATIFYTDGTTAPSGLNLGLSLEPWQTGIYNIGIDANNMTSVNPNKCIKKIEVRIIDSTIMLGNNPTELIKPICYYVDHSYHKCKNFIVWMNGFCLPETMATTGAWEEQFTVSRSFQERILKKEYKTVDGQQYQYCISGRDGHIIRTGWKCREEVDAMREIFLTEELYEVKNGNYIPLLADGTSFNLYSCDDILYRGEFHVVHSMKMSKYSNINLK